MEIEFSLRSIFGRKTVFQCRKNCDDNRMQPIYGSKNSGSDSDAGDFAQDVKSHFEILSSIKFRNSNFSSNKPTMALCFTENSFYQRGRVRLEGQNQHIQIFETQGFKRQKKNRKILPISQQRD